MLCISKDCIFYADFKYMYNITGQRSFEVKQKWRKVKLWSKMMKIAYDNQMVIKCISKDCIFYADFKYVYNLAGPRSFEVKKMTSKVKNRSNLTKTANDHSIIACDPLFERNLKTDYKFDTHMTVKDHLRSKKWPQRSKIGRIPPKWPTIIWLYHVTPYSKGNWNLISKIMVMWP